MFGVDAFNAVVNAAAGRDPRGRPDRRPRRRPSTAARRVRPMLTLTLSFDHRVVDGARAAQFLDALAALVEEPAGLAD